tara:strand:+ start:3463 stop:4575 length:1113 start_codon:yes stop_codon:yes gene_type:complete
MDNTNEKIQLEDITFDDVIGGEGVETTPVAEEPVPPAKEEEKTEDVVEETPAADPVLDEIDEDDEIEDDIEEYEEDETEEEDEDDSDDYDDDTIVGAVLDKLGYEVDKNYDDTTEGLVQMTKDIASNMADERMEEVLDKFPLVKKHLQYVLEGGESQNFMNAYDPNLDYNKLSISEKDVRSQKAILGDYLQTKGHDKEFIQEMLEDFEDTGKLYAKSEAARKALGKYQQAEREQLLEKQRETQAQQAKDLQEFWDDVADTIEESREFAGLRVTEKDKSDFFNYLSRPVTQEGYTQRDLDHSNADMEVKLAIDYLMYKGFDLDTIINTKARTKSVQSLKERISRGEETVKSARRRSKRSTKFDIDDLDLSI